VNQGKYQDALQMYQDALDLSPENTELLTIVGILHLRLGDIDKAFEVLGSSLTIDPRLPKVFLWCSHFRSFLSFSLYSRRFWRPA
jgi:Bardet-Biedl syndrome 4 protein